MAENVVMENVITVENIAAGRVKRAHTEFKHTFDARLPRPDAA